ncbi:MAG: NusG domain II-containing protein [Lachnospirales bacterium]
MRRRNLRTSLHIFKVMDIVLIVSIFFIAIFLLFYLPIMFKAETGDKVIVSVNGQFYGEYNLGENRDVEINVEDNQNIMRISDKMVSMVDANCPDKVCVMHTPISESYEVIVCLPNKVLLTIEKEEVPGKEDENELDSIVS